MAQSVAVDPNGKFNKFTGEPSINEILKAFSRKRGNRIKKYLLSFHKLRDDPESLLVHEYASEAYEPNPSIILAPSVLATLMRIYSKWVLYPIYTLLSTLNSMLIGIKAGILQSAIARGLECHWTNSHQSSLTIDQTFPRQRLFSLDGENATDDPR